MVSTVGSDCFTDTYVASTVGSSLLTPVISENEALISSNVFMPTSDAGARSCGVGAGGVTGGGRLKLFPASTSKVRKNSSESGPSSSGSTAPILESGWPVAGS